MIWGLALAAIAAVFVFIATRVVVSRTGQLTTTQDLLSKAKDRQLQLDLKEKDIKIQGLEADNLKLEEQIEPRRLTKEQKIKIADNCSHFKDLFNGKRVRVVSYSFDVEGFVFAEQIVSSLRSSGMTVDDDTRSITPVGTLIMGINVFGSDSKLAKEIAEAIGSSGSLIAVSFVETDPTAGAIKFEYGSPAPQSTILVGLKPPDKETTEELKSVMTQK
jgi:hypothetical protein